MVGISAEPSFALIQTTQGLAYLFGPLAAFADGTGCFLQALTPCMVVLARPFNGLPAHAGTVTGSREIDHPKIDPDEVGYRQWGRLWQVDDDE